MSFDHQVIEYLQWRSQTSMNVYLSFTGQNKDDFFFTNGSFTNKRS